MASLVVLLIFRNKDVLLVVLGVQLFELLWVDLVGTSVLAKLADHLVNFFDDACELI